MKISIIGAGRVGQTIGRLARRAGYEIGEVVCTTPASAKAAANFIGAGNPQIASRARLSRTDIILISTPDDSIPQAVALIENQIELLPRAVALHTSGALASHALAELARLGLSIASCHPLQTFESPRRAISLVPGSYFCMEGDERALRAARRLVRSLGAKHFEIPTGMKSLYHAAAVMASGGVVALLSISLEMLSRAGLSESEARKVLLPLVEGTIAGLRAKGPARALTGPVRRGDAGTVEQNIRALGAIDPKAVDLYRLLSHRSVELALSAGADKTKMERVKKVLRNR